MEDMTIGDLSRLVHAIEGGETSIADAFGLCPDCGCKDRYEQREWNHGYRSMYSMVTRCANCRRIIGARDIPDR